MTRKGYSTYQKRGIWYVGWTDGHGIRRSVRAGPDRKIAVEIGTARAREADRVRGGSVTQAEADAVTHGKTGIAGHIAAWKKNLLARGRPEKYAAMQATRVTIIFSLADADTLSDLDSECAQDALANVAETSSPQTARHYLTALKGFVRWCMKTGKLFRDPLLAVERPAAHGTTFRRKPLDAAQVAALIHATETRDSRAETISDSDRSMFYRLLAYTGLRKSEAASLAPESFAGNPLVVTVLAGYSKRRRQDELVIRADLAAVMRPWLKAKAPGRPLFVLPSNFERMFRADCKAAGIVAYEGEVLGAHSLRRFFITATARTGGLAVAQDLARHSTPVLTKSYMDLDRSDHDKGLAGLPPLETQVPKGERKIG